jgi:hypothetical protein
VIVPADSVQAGEQVVPGDLTSHRGAVAGHFDPRPGPRPAGAPDHEGRAASNGDDADSGRAAGGGATGTCSAPGTGTRDNDGPARVPANSS